MLYVTSLVMKQNCIWYYIAQFYTDVITYPLKLMLVKLILKGMDEMSIEEIRLFHLNKFAH